MLPQPNWQGARRTCRSRGASPAHSTLSGCKGPGWPHAATLHARASPVCNGNRCPLTLLSPALPAGFTCRGREPQPKDTPQTQAGHGQLFQSTRHAGKHLTWNTAVDAAAATTPVVHPHGSGPQDPQPRQHPGLATTFPAPQPRVPACTSCTHILGAHPATHTRSTYLHCKHAGRVGARLPGCWAGKAAPFSSRQRRGSSPRPRFAWYLGGCSRGKVGRAPCRGG